MTKRALVTILVGLALLLIAATIRSGWLYLTASVLFSLVVIGLISGWVATRQIEVSREAPREVFEREPFEVAVHVVNKGRADRRLVKVRDLQFPGRRRKGFAAKVRAQRAEFKKYMMTGKAPAARHGDRDETVKTVVVEDLPGGSDVEARYGMEAPRRGVYDPAEMRVSSGGVFGSAEIVRKSRTGGRITVFPRIYPIDAFTFMPHANVTPVEPLEWSRKGIGQDYYGIREYARGDSLRHIHWPSSARHGKLIVKEYEQELKPSMVMAVALWEPTFGTRDVNSLEDGLRAAASIISLQEEMGNLPLLVLPDGESFEPVERPTFYGCLETLAGYEGLKRKVSSREALSKALGVALESVFPGTAMVLITNAAPDRVASTLEAEQARDGGSLVLTIDDAYSARWKEEWLNEAPWLAGFAGSNMDLYAITPERGIERCLNEPLNITG